MLIKKAHIKLFLLVLTISISGVYAQGKPVIQTEKDSTEQKEVPITDLWQARDTTVTDSIPVKKSKESLQDIISHTASDTILINLKKNTTTLLNEAKLTYQDVVLEAGKIVIDYKKNTITAFGVKDSTGYAQVPYFKQGAEESTQDSILVNYDTEKALIWGLHSEQDNGIFMDSGISKKVNDSTVYVRDIVITTSDKKNPDYFIGINKAKIIPGKKIVAGASQLYIADVPTPVWVPFAYFPLSKTRSSGLLLPTYGENNEQGYFFQNGGYYFALSDYFDLALTGDIYTNGSWGFSARSNYALRYKFSGNFAFNYENTVFSIKGLSDYSKTTNYNIRWSHSQDAKANPNARLSASVNLGSSKYYRQSYNEYNSGAHQNNQLSSSISYSKKFYGTPFNMSLSATHSQSVEKETIALTLPTLQVSMDRIYPFAPKNGASKNPLHKLGFNYSGSAVYRINTTDAYFLKKEMFNDAQLDVKHSTGLSTNMKLFTYFTLNPSVNYTENWFFEYYNKKYNEEIQEIETDTLQGFKSLRKYTAGMSLSTNIYGTFKFKKGRLRAIRHTIRPSVSYSYNPDLSFYNKEVINTDTGEITYYSPFQSGLHGEGSQSVNLSVNNTFEAKVMPKDSLADAKPKKINLLNNLNFSTSYNIKADSLRLAPVRMSTGVNLFNNQMNVNLNASLDPYALSASGQRIDKMNISNGGSLFRLTGANMTMSYSLSDKTFKKKEEATKDDKNSPPDKGVKEETKVSELYRSKIPWNLRINYTLRYSNSKRENTISNNSLMFSGDVELSPKWQVGFSSSYDFKGKGMGNTSLNFQRDLDSWIMRFRWVPFGTYQTYYFFIGVKSSVLSDLKYDKRRLPDKKLF